MSWEIPFKAKQADKEKTLNHGGFWYVTVYEKNSKVKKCLTHDVDKTSNDL